MLSKYIARNDLGKHDGWYRTVNIEVNTTELPYRVTAGSVIYSLRIYCTKFSNTTLCILPQ